MFSYEPADSLTYLPVTDYFYDTTNTWQSATLLKAPFFITTPTSTALFQAGNLLTLDEGGIKLLLNENTLGMSADLWSSSPSLYLTSKTITADPEISNKVSLDITFDSLPLES
jgi:hypothetical protein